LMAGDRSLFENAKLHGELALITFKPV